MGLDLPAAAAVDAAALAGEDDQAVGGPHLLQSDTAF